MRIPAVSITKFLGLYLVRVFLLLQVYQAAKTKREILYKGIAYVSIRQYTYNRSVYNCL